MAAPACAGAVPSGSFAACWNVIRGTCDKTCLSERKKRAKHIDITVTPARKLARAEQRALEAEVERYGVCLGLEPVLKVE